MKRAFSYAIVLHRVFDSAAPEKESIFRAGGRILHPYRKPGGLYVFADEPEQTMEILCPAYQTETVQTKQGETTHVCLYPAGTYCPPAGWSVTSEHAPPETVLFYPDKTCNVRLLACDFATQAVRLRAVPGFTGGCLRFSKDGFSRISLILGKEPPDWYYLSALDVGFADCKVEKGYAARADAAGSCALVAPAGSAF